MKTCLAAYVLTSWRMDNFSPDRHLDALLVQRLQAREPAAMADLYDRFARVIFSTVRRIVVDEAVAEDLVQEIFLGIWSNPDRFQPERGNFFGWIMTVARNRANDYLRSGEGRISQCRAGLTTLRSNQYCDAYQFTVSLTKAVEALSANQREVIRLAYYEGMSHTEMALQMNKPLGTVKSWAKAALVTLRREVGLPATGGGLQSAA